LRRKFGKWRREEGETEKRSEKKQEEAPQKVENRKERRKEGDDEIVIQFLIHCKLKNTTEN
jgi:hypothetical protein